MQPASDERAPLLVDVSDPENIPVAPLIDEIREKLESILDTALSWQFLISPDINLALVRPIVLEWREKKNKATIFAFLRVRCFFLQEAARDIGNIKLHETRADICQLVASRLLRSFTMRELIDVLTYDFSAEQGDPRHSLPSAHSGKKAERFNCLELAIEGRAKYFVSNSLVQEVLNQIWHGNVVFFATAIDAPMSFTVDGSVYNHSRLKFKRASIHNPAERRLLLFSRLRVPKYKSLFEGIMFAGFILLYTVVLFNRNKEITSWEITMELFALAYTFEEIRELRSSGPIFYFENIWNMFDFAILVIFLTFLSLRIYSLHYNSDAIYTLAFDLLACNSILLWPRLFAVLDHYQFFGTMLIVIRHMMIDTTLFFALLVVFFLGFLHAFFVLGHDQFTYPEIAWLLIRIFFGSAFLGFDVADKFHPIIGPIVMTLFIGISTLILMSVLISIFNQSFGAIIDNANEEFLFLFCIRVVEYIRSDEVFEYIPPFNIAQIVILKPLRLILPRLWSAHLNRLTMTILFFPMLLGIYIYEWFVGRRTDVQRWEPDVGIQRSGSFAIPNSGGGLHSGDSSHSNPNAGEPQQQHRHAHPLNRGGRQAHALMGQQSRTWEILQPNVRFLEAIKEDTVSPRILEEEGGNVEDVGLGGNSFAQGAGIAESERDKKQMELDRKIDGLTERFERMEELMRQLVNQLGTERSAK